LLTEPTVHDHPGDPGTAQRRPVGAGAAASQRLRTNRELITESRPPRTKIPGAPASL